MTLLAYLDVVLTVLPRYLRLALIGRVQAGLVRSAITALIARRGGANTIRPLARAILSGMLHSAEQIVSFAIWTRARSLSGLATWRIPLPPIHDASTAPSIATLLKRLAALHHRLNALDVHARRLARRWERADACPLRLDAAHRSTSPDCVGGGNHTPQLFSSPARARQTVGASHRPARSPRPIPTSHPPRLADTPSARSRAHALHLAHKQELHGHAHVLHDMGGCFGTVKTGDA